VVGRLTMLLVPALVGRALVRVQSPLAISNESEPEPDLGLGRAANLGPAPSSWLACCQALRTRPSIHTPTRHMPRLLMRTANPTCDSKDQARAVMTAEISRARMARRYFGAMPHMMKRG